MRNKISEGDIFIISDVIMPKFNLILNKKVRLGKIIFVSKVSNKVIGFMISSVLVDGVSENIASENISDIEFLDHVFYTGNQLLKSGSWPIIGNQIVTDYEKDLTLRIIGNSLWRLDTNLGMLDVGNRNNYKKQLIQGFGGLYENIDKF